MGQKLYLFILNDCIKSYLSDPKRWKEVGNGESRNRRKKEETLRGKKIGFKFIKIILYVMSLENIFSTEHTLCLITFLQRSVSWCQ